MNNQRYLRNGKPAIFDPIRQVLILETPEEIVRQTFFLRLEKLGYPKGNIQIEFPISRIAPKTKGRLDIIAFANPNTPLIIFELKKEAAALTDNTLDQVKNYNRHVKAKYIAISNGRDIRYYHFLNGEYRYIKNEPTFAELIAESDLKYGTFSINVRPMPYQYLETPAYAKTLQKDGIIGQDTPANLHAHIANLDNFLMTSNRITDLPYVTNELSIIEDLHISARDYGNVGGGIWAGAFRSFLVKDLNSEAQVYRIAIMGNAKTKNHPRFGTRRGTTSLLVSVDDYEYSVHNSLQLTIDDSLTIEHDSVQYHHNGSMTVGNKGAVKREIVLSYIQENYSSVLPVTEQGVFLGALPGNKKIEWPDAIDFVSKLILYANIRDILRKQLVAQ